jgi:type VI secretion system protein ImpH
MQINDHALLFYAGLLAHQPRSLAALEAMLGDYFQVTVEAVPFIGQWLSLEDSETTRLGVRRGRNQALGHSVVLGNRAWDQQGKFELHLGPLKLQQFLDFLPTGWGFIPLCELTRFFVGAELDYDFRLRLAAADVPACRLHGQEGARLGWSSWLKNKPFTRDAEIRLSPRLLPPPSPGGRGE